MTRYKFNGGVLLSRLLLGLFRQLKNPLGVPEGGTAAPFTDAIAVVVEQVGVVVLMALVGWWLATSFGSIWYFVGAVIFGALGSVLRSYYQTRLEMDEAMNRWRLERKQSNGSGSGEGFSGLLEGSTTCDINTSDE